MNLSPLQEARYVYQPKLPGMLRNGISEISVKIGSETSSVADQDKIKELSLIHMANVRSHLRRVRIHQNTRSKWLA